MKKLFKRNRHWSTDDKLLAGVAVVGAIGIFAIIKQRSKVPTVTAASGFRGIGEYFTTPLRGLGAYFVDPVVKPISGLGVYRGR